MKNKKFESIKKNNEISKLFSSGKILTNSNFIFKYIFVKNKMPRLGLSTSKKHFKSAVLRNKIKRQLRNIFYSLDDLLLIDLLIIVKPSYNEKKYFEMETSLKSLYKKIK